MEVWMTCICKTTKRYLDNLKNLFKTDPGGALCIFQKIISKIKKHKNL